MENKMAAEDIGRARNYGWDELQAAEPQVEAIIEIVANSSSDLVCNKKCICRKEMLKILPHVRHCINFSLWKTKRARYHFQELMLYRHTGKKSRTLFIWTYHSFVTHFFQFFYFFLQYILKEVKSNVMRVRT